MSTMASTRLILASSSPRRQELLREQGFDFEVMDPPLNEPTSFAEPLSPAALAQALSHYKAQSVAAQVDQGLILAGDTIAALGDRVFGKPQNREDARKILRALAGTTHEVITGITLLNAATGARMIRHDSTGVTMRALSDEEIESYLDTNAWQGKAGAYGIQDHGDAFVEKIDGSFSNVVGLPVELITAMLAEWGVEKSATSKTKA